MTIPEDANHGSVDVRGTKRRRDDQIMRRSDLPDPPTVSNLDLTGLMNLAVAAWDFSALEAASVPLDETPEQMLERERREVEDRRKREANMRQKQELFRSALNDTLADVYKQGADAAVDKAERTAWNARSVALYLLVFAVVAMPAIAMLAGITPQDFGSYVAPITGIAGTVVGYWFSRSGG
jgi:hypothetical protein